MPNNASTDYFTSSTIGEYITPKDFKDDQTIISAMMAIKNEKFHPFTASSATEQKQQDDYDTKSTGSIKSEEVNMAKDTAQEGNLSNIGHLRLRHAILKTVCRDFRDGFLPKSVETHIDCEDCPKGTFRK